MLKIVLPVAAPRSAPTTPNMAAMAQAMGMGGGGRMAGLPKGFTPPGGMMGGAGLGGPMGASGGGMDMLKALGGGKLPEGLGGEGGLPGLGGPKLPGLPGFGPKK